MLILAAVKCCNDQVRRFLVSIVKYERDVFSIRRDRKHGPRMGQYLLRRPAQDRPFEETFVQRVIETSAVRRKSQPVKRYIARRLELDQSASARVAVPETDFAVPRNYAN